MKVLLNTNMCRVFSVGMYESRLTPNLEMDMFISDPSIIPMEEQSDFLCSVSFNMDKYKEGIIEASKELLKELFSEIPFSVKLVEDSYSIYSPKEYNYWTDYLEFLVEVPDDVCQLIWNEIESDSDFFEKELPKYGSSIGFYSFMPSTKQEFIKHLKGSGKKECEFTLSIYLAYVLNKEDESNLEKLIKKIGDCLLLECCEDYDDLLESLKQKYSIE